MQRISEFGAVEGIRLADSEQSEAFRTIVPAALRLLKEVDSRRFRRLQRHVGWIANCALPGGGGAYHHPTRTCRLDFVTSRISPDFEYVAGAVASTLVHEATHALIEARGIEYAGEKRRRIEKTCVKEQNRFARRVAATRPHLARAIEVVFDESEWRRSWAAGRLQNFFDTVRRVVRQG